MKLTENAKQLLQSRRQRKKLLGLGYKIVELKLPNFEKATDVILSESGHFVYVKTKSSFTVK